MISNSSPEKPDGRANRSVEEGIAQAQQQQQTETSSDQDSLDNDRMPYTTMSSKSEYIDPLRSTFQQQYDATTPPEVYDPENPKPTVLTQEEGKHVNFAKQVGDPTKRESRLANAENVLSWKSVVCWSLLTIVLVGGSLAAVIATVDWSVTADGDAAGEMTNSTVGGSP